MSEQIFFEFQFGETKLLSRQIQMFSEHVTFKGVGKLIPKHRELPLCRSIAA